MTYPSFRPDPASLIADKSWRLRHSAWLLAPVLGCGMLSFVGFIYVAIRVRTRKFWIAAAIGSIGSAAVWIALALSGDLDETTESTTKTAASSSESMSDVGFGVVLAVWAALLVYAFMLNRDYLRWRAGLTNSNAWYNQHASNAGSAYGQSPAAGQTPGFLGVNQSNYYAAPNTAANPPSQASAGYSHPVPQPAPQVPPPVAQRPAIQPPVVQSVVPVDVNGATAYTLVHNLGIEPNLAARVIAVRDSRGGFAHLDDMVATAGLQPHELVRFQNKVTFGRPEESRSVPPASPPPTQGPSGGRIIDI